MTHDSPHRLDASSCAFVVLAHRQPGQILRLVGRLAPAPVFLHVDAGAPSHVHRQLLAHADRYPSLRFLPRVRSSWGGWGIVEAELSGLRAAPAIGVSHAVILTGQDYPLVRAAEIHAFSRAHEGKSFIASWQLPSPLWGRRGGMERIRHWHYPILRRRFRLPVARSFPSGIKPFGGSAYCMLSRTAIGDVAQAGCRAVLSSRVDPHEMLVSTALLNSRSRDDIIDENLWFMDWPPGGVKHPRVLNLSDAGALLTAAARESSAAGRARAKLFARKFDVELDAAILDILDRRALDVETALR